MEDVLELAPRLDAGAARRLAGRILERRGRPLALDATAVTMVSALALEVIIAASRQWDVDEQPLMITGCSDVFAAGCTTLGLDPQHPWVTPVTIDNNSGAA